MKRSSLIAQVLVRSGQRNAELPEVEREVQRHWEIEHSELDLSEWDVHVSREEIDEFIAEYSSGLYGLPDLVALFD